jgi:hypothetical protein
MNQKSVLNGFLQDPEGQFSYHFFDLANVAGGNEKVLQFPGNWRHAAENGTPGLNFDDEKEDGTAGTFDLPASINLDPNINEFVYDTRRNGGRLREPRTVRGIRRACAFLNLVTY